MGSLLSPGPSTTTYQPPAAVTAAYTDLINRAGGLLSTGAPYYDPSTAQAYAGFVPGLVAQQTPDQINAINNITNLQGYTDPNFAAATALTTSAAAPVQMQQFSPDAINQYMSPYMNDVVNSAVQNINQTNAQQQQQVLGNSIQRGAFGGDRAGIAQAELARQQGLAGNATIANLLSQGYGQALGEFNQQQGVDIANQLQNRNLLSSNAMNLANLGTAGQTAALQQAQAQYGAGATEQQQQQANLSTAYQQYLNQYQFPYNQLGFYGGLVSGASSGLGGTTTGTAATPSLGSTILGLGTTIGSMGTNSIFGQALGYKSGGAVNHYDGGGVVPSAANSVAPTNNPANQPIEAAYNTYMALANSGNASLHDLRNAYNAYVGTLQPTPGAALPTKAVTGPAPTTGVVAATTNTTPTNTTASTTTPDPSLARVASGGVNNKLGGNTTSMANGPYNNGGGPGYAFNSGGVFGNLISSIAAGLEGTTNVNTTPAEPGYTGVVSSMDTPVDKTDVGGFLDKSLTKDDNPSNRGGRIEKAKGGVIPYAYGLVTKDDLSQLNQESFGSGTSDATPSEEAFASADILSGMRRGGVVGHFAPGGAATDDSSDDSSDDTPIADTSVIQGSAKNAGIPVDQFVKLSQGESGRRFKLGDDNSSAGPFQLHVGGASDKYPNPGKGDDFFNEMHPDLAEKLTPQQKAAYINDPSHLQETSDWTANEIAKNGANAWTVARQQGLLGANQADMPYVNAKNASAPAADQTPQNKSILSGIFPSLNDPERLAMFKFGTTLMGTPGSFGMGLAKAADAYANQLVESQKLASESNLRAAQAEAQKGEAITKRATLGRAGALVSTMNPDGSISLQQIPIGGMGGGQPTPAIPSAGGGEFNVPPASQSGPAATPSGGGAGPSGGGTPQTPNAPSAPTKPQPLQTFAYGSVRDDGMNADKKYAAIQQEIDAINNDVSAQYGPRQQQLATQSDEAQKTANKEGTAAYNGRQDLQTLTKVVASQDSTGLLASGIQKAFRDRMANYAQTVGAMTGNDLGLSDKLSAQEQANKIATWASVQQGRHAGFITQGLENAFPTGALQPETQRSLLASMITQSKRAQDMQKFTTDYNQKTNNLGWNAENVFQKTNPPSEYARDASAIAALMDLSDKTPAGQGNLHPNPITDLMNRKYGAKSAEYFDQYVHNLYVKTGDPRFAVHNLSRYFE